MGLVKIVDLTAQLEDKMVRYPSPYFPDVSVKQVASHEREGRSAQVLTFGSHTSTHVDAPYHSIPNGATLDKVPLSQLAGIARVIRFPNRDKHSALDEKDFSIIPNLDQTEKLVIDTGWSKKMWGTEDYFTEGPFLTRAASKYLASLPLLHLLGMDFPNIECCEDMVMGKPAPNHQILLGRNIVMVENLVNLSEIDEHFFFSALTPRVVGGDGCPCRAMAIFPLSSFSEALGQKR